MSQMVNDNESGFQPEFDMDFLDHNEVLPSPVTTETVAPVANTPVANTEVVDLENSNGQDSEGDEHAGEGKKGKNRSWVWAYFDEFYDKEEGNLRKGKCKYCSRVIKAGQKKHGTKSLINHVKICKRIQAEKKQMKINISEFARIAGDNISLWKHDETKCRKALVYMIVMDELPFRTVEHLGFKYFVSILNPQFKIPSRKTIGADILKLYLEEKEKLKAVIKNSSQRVSITTDTWTSCQKINYMCVTGHFVDNEWNLQKKILCFRPIKGHKGAELGQALERCLREWGIDKIFTITVDNASSNDGCIAHIRKNMESWKTSILGGTYIHMRCIAHIMNLIVQDGLNEEEGVVKSIRGFVRYVRSSASRHQAFLQCVTNELIESKKLLSLDVPTRWNSTYLMLEAATTLQSAFESYEASDDTVRKDLMKLHNGVPTDTDWNRAKCFVKFLSHFYELTVSVSGSYYVTCNTIFHDVSMVETLLQDWIREENDMEFKRMAQSMQKKYDKYWGSSDKMNKLIYYVVVLDPRCKLNFLVNFAFKKMFRDEQTRTKMKRDVTDGLEELFNEYAKLYGDVDKSSSQNLSSSSSSMSTSFERGAKRAKTYLWTDYQKEMNDSVGDQVKSELQKYLAEDVERPKEGVTFDILKWWSKKAEWFPILSKMARDILGVPASTVASESAFSTGGRVLDPFRSSLLSKTVEALVCTQDWLRGSATFGSLEEDIQEIYNLEKECEKLQIK